MEFGVRRPSEKRTSLIHEKTTEQTSKELNSSSPLSGFTQGYLLPAAFTCRPPDVMRVPQISTADSPNHLCDRLPFPNGPNHSFIFWLSVFVAVCRFARRSHKENLDTHAKTGKHAPVDKQQITSCSHVQNCISRLRSNAFNSLTTC